MQDDVAHAGAGAHAGALDRIVHDGHARREDAALGQHRRVAGNVEPQQAQVHVGGGDVGAQVQRHQAKILQHHLVLQKFVVF